MARMLPHAAHTQPAGGWGSSWGAGALSGPRRGPVSASDFADGEPMTPTLLSMMATGLILAGAGVLLAALSPV